MHVHHVQYYKLIPYIYIYTRHIHILFICIYYTTFAHSIHVCRLYIIYIYCTYAYLLVHFGSWETQVLCQLITLQATPCLSRREMSKSSGEGSKTRVWLPVRVIYFPTSPPMPQDSEEASCRPALQILGPG